MFAILLAIRVPSVVEPAGGDQGLYGYSGQRILAGAVPYRDIWDQKPPGIAFVYAALWRIWPHESVVAIADLAVAATTAWLIVVIGRRRFSDAVGYGAAGLFLLFGDPSLQRMSGVYARGQCEPFMALAVTLALVLLAGPLRRRWHLVLAGVCLAAACWLKYNAAAYLLPVALAAWVWRRDDVRVYRAAPVDLAWVGLGFALVTTGVLIYFGANGALHDLRLATIDYNLRYSGETYPSLWSVPRYLATFPIERARVDMLWFLGGIGALSLVWWARSNRSTLVVIGWLIAALVSIAVNGSRSLPHYFVQAGPALALAAVAGIGAMLAAGGWRRYTVALLILVGLWRVGDDAPVAGVRLGGLPGLAKNVRFDLSYALGHVDRVTYLSRFKGEQKFDALEIDDLSRFVRETTKPTDPIFVFGFAGGSVCWKSERTNATRFFWSWPVILEFAADEPGYGSAGMLADLKRLAPVQVALQKEQQWQSQRFFMNNGPLRDWLLAGYVLDHETPMFAVWRRKP